MPYLPFQHKQSWLYHSYLVRLWQADQETTWRALVQCVQSGETLHFADLDLLFAFLTAQTAARQSIDQTKATHRGDAEESNGGG